MGDQCDTSLVEVTEVLSAVKRLNDLGCRMRAKLFGFNDTDVAHIDKVIDALHELEQNKAKALDFLETETIKCSAVRHKLMHYPDEINREIHEAVQASRVLNEETIEKIKTQLLQLTIELEDLENQTSGVDVENEVLRPDLLTIKNKFDGNFAKLNDLLGEKSGQQIGLNEDMEAIKQASTRIVELEEDEVRLAERMAIEKLEHRETVTRLHEETKVAMQQLEVSSEKESKVRHEYIVVYLAYEQLISELEECIKVHKQLTTELEALERLERETRLKVEQTRRKKEELQTSVESVAAETKSCSENHEARMEKMKKKSENMQTTIQELTVLKEKVATQKAKVKARTETIVVTEADLKNFQVYKEEDLQKARHDISVKSEQLKRLRLDIADMESRQKELEDAGRAEREGWLDPSDLLENGSERLVNFMEAIKESSGDGEECLPPATVMEIKDTIELHRYRRQMREARLAKDKKPELFHRATELDIDAVLTYNKQIAELKERLGQARENTLKTQTASEKLLAAIEKLSADEIAQDREVGEEMEKLKQENSDLDAEQNRLLAKMRTDDTRKDILIQRLANGRRQLGEARASRQAEIERIKLEIRKLGEETAAKAAEEALLTPKFEEFRQFYERSTGEYDAMKRCLGRLKNRQSGLEESSKKAKEDIGRLTGQIASLQRDKERCLAESNSQMDEIAAHRVATEKEIYALGCKLRTVLVENARLEAGIDQLEKEMRSMRDTWEEAVPAKARMDQQRTVVSRQLQVGLKEDLGMSAEAQENDKRLLAVLSVILGETQARLVIVKAVNEGLGLELDNLSDYLRTSADEAD